MKKLVILLALALIGSLLVFYGGQTATASHGTGGPVAYWPFDEGSGTTATDVAHGNDGTISGATYTGGGVDAAPISGNVDALHFASSGDLVRVSDDALLRPAKVTVSVWARNDGTPTTYDYILAKTLDGGKASYALYTGGSAGLFFYASDTTFHLSDNAGASIWDGSWHHIAGTYDGSDVRLFVDGSEIGTANAGPSAIAYGTTVFSGDLSIGSYGNTFSPLADWRGDIDEVKIYDRALSGDEIISLYLTGDTGTLFVDRDGEVGLGSSVACDGTGVFVYDVIQDAVDATGSGDTVLLCDYAPFGQSVVFGPEDSGITLGAVEGASPVLDGTGPADSGATIDPNSGIKLLDGVIDVEIISLELTGFSGTRGSGISAWDVSTSNIEVRDNYIHDNAWNGILVGSEGAKIHDNWIVTDNIVDDNGFVGIELTNVVDSEIRENFVRDNFLHGILVQARNTIGTSVSPTVSNADVWDNEVSGTVLSYGIRFLAYEGLTGPPFTSIGATARITDSEVAWNYVHDNAAGILLQAFNAGATTDDLDVRDNRATLNAGNGIRLFNADDSDIRNNLAAFNGANGILVSADSTGNTFFHNTAAHNGLDGILVEGGDSDLYGNNAHHNGDDGIEESSTGDCSQTGSGLTRNKAKFNGGDDFVNCP